MKNAKIIIVAAILLVAFVLRLHKLNAPLADWHSWRQADTAAVARHYYNYGLDFLHPKYDDLSSIPSGLENPEGYRMVEFPIMSALHALVAKFASMYSFEAVGRLVSIFFSLASILFIFLIIKFVSGFRLALISAAVYGLLPYNIYYNRVILPEPAMVAFSLASVYFFLVGEKNKIINISLSFIFLVTALLLKPFALFIVLPPMLWVVWQKKRSLLLLALFVGLSLVPFFAWRQWISQFPEGIPANTWLLNGDSIRGKGAWFYWLFAERFVRLILGYWGIVFFALGLLLRTKLAKDSFYFLWFLGALAYLIIVATGNVRHDYYQILIIPATVVLVARGIYYLATLRTTYLSVRILLIGVGIAFMEAFGWYQVRDLFNINHPEIVKAGQAVASFSLPQDKVIAPYGGDTAFLYQTQRKGWPIGGEIQAKIASGAKWYVSTVQDQEAKEVAEQCQTVVWQENQVIIKLDCRL